MPINLNPLVCQTSTPPIAEVQSWIAGYDGTFGPVLNVAQAVPSFLPAEALRQHLARTVMDGDSAFYTDIEGLMELRHALAAHMSTDYLGSITPEQVSITSGCNQAFCVAMTALAAPGDEVILPAPYYFNHQMWLEMQGVRPVHLPFAENTAGIPNPEALTSLITSKTRAIALVSPNNPTGAEYPPDIIEAFYNIAKDASIALIIDETYKDFRSSGTPPHHLFQKPDWQDTFVHLYSFSKAYSLTGYRVGSVITGPALQAEIGKLLDCMSICASQIGQHAALYGLQHLSDWRQSMCADMAERVDTMRSVFATTGLDYRLISSGAFFAYVRHPFTGEDSNAVSQRLAKKFGILTLPGSMFGPGQDNYLRFAFANLESRDIPSLADRLLQTQ